MKTPLKRFFVLLLGICSSYLLLAQTGLKSPDDFLPYEHGTQFTPHHLLVDYFEHVAENSDRLVLQEYGRTNEGRPLLYGIISTPENLKRIEQIRLNHLRKTGLIEGAVDDSEIAVVWLSYGVHGNEAGASESSLAAVYELTRPDRSDVQKWLNNTIVIMDPCINPDGFSRYTHWNIGTSNKVENPDPGSREHHEPWPGGRVNHYLFDLNRDWAWQTQTETRQRIKVYQQWLPHVHVDFHEMGHNDPYYFAPAGQPYHPYITDWQVEFQHDVGHNHAKYFDKQGWTYFTREVFDLFYPSYGDTYPIFTGAIGMTYEQGGHSRAGRAIKMNNGDTLRLMDRIEHHLTTSLSTVEVSANSANSLNKNYQDYFKKARTAPGGPYKSYVIKHSNKPARIKALCELLDRNQIRYGRIKGNNKSLTAYDYATGKSKNVDVSTNDLVISAHQPMSVLIQVLFDPEATLVDSITYDITAWAMPYAYGLEAYALKDRLDATEEYRFAKAGMDSNKKTLAYAYILEWNSLNSARFLSALYKRGIKVRCATKGFELEGKKYEQGSLIALRADNKNLGDRLATLVAEAAKEVGEEITAVNTGFASKGPDMGSDKMRLLERPNVLAVSGEGVSANSFGQVWHYFEQELNYPLSIIDTESLKRANLDQYNLLIMPEGWYGSRLGKETLEKIKTWIQAGGRVIAIGAALSSFEGKPGFSLKKFASESDENKEKKRKEKAAMERRFHNYGDQERRSISYQMPGAIFEVNIDNTHPLGYGLSDRYFSLKTSSRAYQLLKDTWNVGYIGKKPFVLGFAGAKAKSRMKETTVFGVQNMGRGRMVYMVDNPLFRGFWEQGKFLFSNAVFLTGI